jgi:hypothetical protein
MRASLASFSAPKLVCGKPADNFLFFEIVGLLDECEAYE